MSDSDKEDNGAEVLGPVAAPLMDAASGKDLADLILEDPTFAAAEAEALAAEGVFDLTLPPPPPPPMSLDDALGAVPPPPQGDPEIGPVPAVPLEQEDWLGLPPSLESHDAYEDYFLDDENLTALAAEDDILDADMLVADTGATDDGALAVDDLFATDDDLFANQETAPEQVGSSKVTREDSELNLAAPLEPDLKINSDEPLV